MWIRYVSNHLVFFFVNIFVDLVYKFFISMSPRGHTCVHFETISHIPLFTIVWIFQLPFYTNFTFIKSQYKGILFRLRDVFVKRSPCNNKILHVWFSSPKMHYLLLCH